MRSTTELAPSESGPANEPNPAVGPDIYGQDKPELRAIVRVDHTGPPLQLFTAKGFEWVDAQLPIPGLPGELDGFRILHISDLHGRRFWDPAYDDLISRVRENPPDLIAITGDFAENRYDHRGEMATIRRFVGGLKSRLGTVAIFGNHDGDLMRPKLEALKLTAVDHRRLSLHSGSATLELIGVGGVEREDFDPVFLHSLGAKGPNTVRILLSHYPDLVRSVGFLEGDIYLTGHTHGGQICFPGRIPIVRHDSLSMKFISGINRYQQTWLVVNRGLGFSSVPIRLFCPAEVIEIRLRKAGGS